MTTLTTLAIGMPGMGELLIILAIVVLIFGASKLPQLGDALGKGIKNFRKATSGEKKKEEAEETTPAAPRAELPPESASTAAKVEDVQARDVTPKE